MTEYEIAEEGNCEEAKLREKTGELVDNKRQALVPPEGHGVPVTQSASQQRHSQHSEPFSRTQ